MTLVKQVLFILPEHQSSFLVFSGIRVARSSVFYVVFCRSLFVLFLLVIVLSVLSRFTDSEYTFGIFKLFFIVCLLAWWWLTSLSTMFQWYRGGQFYWWRKPEDPEKTTDKSQCQVITCHTESRSVYFIHECILLWERKCFLWQNLNLFVII